jgi:membrane associated rhomboid family serine protease
VAAISLASMVVWAISTQLLEPLILLSYEVRSGQIWRIVTWPFVNEPSIWTVLSVAIFYLFGRELERVLGRVRFAWLLVALTVVPGIVATVLGLDGIFGLRTINTGVFLMFVMMYPTARSWFEIPLWVFGAVFLGIEVLQLVGLREWDQLIFLAVTLATALIALRSLGLSDQSWIPRIPLPGGDGSGAPRRKRRAARRRGPAEVVPIRNEQPTPNQVLEQAEINILLEKINDHGLDSLTKDERRRLDDYSRRLRRDR